MNKDNFCFIYNAIKAYSFKEYDLVYAILFDM